jgi:PilZ domain
MNIAPVADSYQAAKKPRRSVPSPRLRAEQRQRRAVHSALKEVIRQYKSNHAREERRRQGRVEFLQTVRLRLENGRELTVLSRDLSLEGIRLVGTSSLLGQKVHLFIPRGEGANPLQLVLRILWTCTVGDGLFENGGDFLEMVEESGWVKAES